jgi:hypothetical protein
LPQRGLLCLDFRCVSASTSVAVFIASAWYPAGEPE